MTDTYIWKKVKERFYSMKRKELNESTGEYEDVWFPYFMKCEHPEDETPVFESVTYPDFKDVIDTVTLNVIEPNITAPTPSDDIWFELFPLHSKPVQVEWGANGRNRWILGMQININAPRNAIYGTATIDEVYDFIADNFKRGDVFDGIRVLDSAYRSSAQMQSTFYSVPVTIMFQADLKK